MKTELRPFDKNERLSGSDLQTLRDWLHELPGNVSLTAEYSVSDLVQDLDSILDGMWSDGIDDMGDDA
ncbi:hypothetical protein [Bradyrhizobium sp. Tv2a-2]|uniref:hypothetical protein n=1 Tax=Bradyrhizobium sp. Tv2a-2 TaxID=113395 RepID=UPI0004679269|nr:hypothetical protein [Bradyrhizobium sp. Tv2a-2]